MELKPGYKQTEVGVIPESWDAKSMGEIGTLAMGKGLLKEDIRSIGRIPAIPYTALYTDFTEVIDYTEIKWFVEEESAPYVVNEPCVLIASSSNMEANTGKAAALPDSLRVAVGREVISFKSFCEPRYVSYLLSTFAYRRKTLSVARGTTIKHVYPATFVGFAIAVPPLPEQRAIATALSDVDALLAKLDALIAKKRDLKVAAMQQLLTGQTRLPGFSGEWEVKRLGELFAFSGGHTASRDQLSDTGYCYLHYGDIHLSKKTFIDVDAEFLELPKLVVALSDVSTASILKDGDVVFVDASEDDEGTSKHIVVVNRDGRPYISGLHTIVAKSKANRIDNLFKRYCFQTRNIKEQFRFFAVGTKVSGISKTSVAKVELHFPPSLEEQTAIATVLADMDTELTALQARRDKTRALKQGMMQELLTGRIRLL